MTHARRVGLICSLLLLPQALSAKDQTPPDYGAKPAHAATVQAAERQLRDTLIDPDSGRFEWPYGFAQMSLKPLLGKRRVGYFTCGHVNARNRMGGYTGRAWFYVLVRDGALIDYQIGMNEEIDTASVLCEDSVKKGELPPPPAYEVPASNGRPLGIDFKPTPWGAIITSVAPGSPADIAGLKAGHLIVAVNGKSIAGLSFVEAITAVQTPGAKVVFSILGASDITIDRNASR